MRLVGIRKRLWDSGAKIDPRDIAEAFRDVDSQLREITQRRVITGTFKYSPPFYLSYDSVPVAVTLVSIKPYKAKPAVIDAGMVAWDYQAPRIQIVGIAGSLVVGTQYDMTFEVIG